MSTTINMLDAKSSLSKLVHALESGAEDEFVIARNGRPAARLVPLAGARAGRERRIGVAAGRFEVPDDARVLDAEVRTLIEGGA